MRLKHLILPGTKEAQNKTLQQVYFKCTQKAIEMKWPKIKQYEQQNKVVLDNSKYKITILYNKLYIHIIVQFNSVQSLSHVRLSVTP